eukprot:scaffold8171_cov63-Phaeocystis_antarctica.AAC.2
MYGFHCTRWCSWSLEESKDSVKTRFGPLLHPARRVRHWRGVAARGHAQCEHQRAQMGLRDSEPQAMLVDEPCEAACSAEALAAVFTCAELQSLLDLYMPPPDVEVVEDALAL